MWLWLMTMIEANLTIGGAMGNKKDPLGLPPGSIRAILALIMTVATFCLFIFGITVPTEWIAINGAVVAFYMGLRSLGPGQENIPTPGAPYIGDDN